MSVRKYAPNYVFIDKSPGMLGGAWWIASVALVLDLPVDGLIDGGPMIGWWSLPAGLASWGLYSLWRVESTHIWHSELAHALLGRWLYRRYPTEEQVRTGDYFDA